jgi:hypothetical protein
VKVIDARPTSARAVLIGLPASSAMVRANSSERAPNPSAIRRKDSARAWRGSSRISAAAASAQAIASSTSPREATEKRASGSEL